MTTTALQELGFKKMKPSVKEKWLAALRSGDYKQTRGYLKTEKGGTERYCCLGVLCDVLGKPLVESNAENTRFDKIYGVVSLEKPWQDGRSRKKVIQDELPHDALLESVGLDHSVASELASKNDKGSKFTSIANWIEKNL